MKTLYFSLFAIVSFFTACQPNATKPAAANVSTNAARNAAAPTPNTEVKRFQGKGVVTEVRKNTGEVELDHEEIKGHMPAMQMMFHVENPAQLNDLKVGDKVEFTVEDRGANGEKMTQIKKLQ